MVCVYKASSSDPSRSHDESVLHERSDLPGFGLENGYDLLEHRMAFRGRDGLAEVDVEAGGGEEGFRED